MTLPASIPPAALVTGGAARLGRAIALSLARAGVAVAVHCRTSRDAAEATAADCRGLGVGACVLQADLADDAERDGLVGRAAEALGPIGILVNNASLFERDEWDDATRESWDAHLLPNSWAPFALTQEFARLLPADAEGCVINLLDQRVWSLTPHFVSYTVSKSALWSLTRSLALALAPRIRVNAVGPGPAAPSPRQTQEQFDRQCAALPLRRGTSPDEVAEAAMALLRLPSVTGQMIAVDGGQHLQYAPSSGPAAEE
jgi:NAD(P)-dependent dehydrogenase (short-subunit alcohol dehydrogenase family)